ncbi:unnamed protein product, partial [Meganyctiphanes norvegica]
MSEDLVVRVRGLPWSATVDEIYEFFDGVDILGGKSGIHLTMTREGRPSGEAYIELESEEDLEAAEKKHKETMGSRYIEVFKAKKSEMEWVTKHSGYESNNKEEDGVVRLRGLPYGCSKEEITNFFSGLEIYPNGIAFPPDFGGRPSGEAYVQFNDKETCEKALERNKQMIAHRYIEIFRSSLNEVRAAMSGGNRRGGSGGPMGGGYNSRSAPYDLRDRIGGSNRISGRSSGYNDGPGWGGRGHGGYNDVPSWGGRGGGPGIGGGYGGGTGHFVHCRGLPFRATEMDIADFFRPLNTVNIEICYDKSGRPSGEADIEFATHEDAVEAMSKHKCNMQHRYVELFLNSTAGGHGGGGPGGNFGGGYNGFNSNSGFGPGDQMSGNNYNNFL